METDMAEHYCGSDWVEHGPLLFDAIHRLIGRIFRRQ